MEKIHGKKGFTLIELLAVIVVLAIIALIAVPIMLNIIESARKGAIIAGARNYIKSVESYAILSELNKEKISLEKNNKYNVTISTTINEKNYKAINDLVEVKGIKPNGLEDYIVLSKDNRVEEALFTINGYQILIRNDEIVSIIKGKIIEAESIVIDKETAKLEVGQTLKLEATITPDDAIDKRITWTSSDENVATVDSNGMITGLKAGEVIITAKTNNGKIAKCNVNITSKLYLYKSGEEFNDTTGGWNVLYYNNSTDYYHNWSLDKFEKTNDYIRILVNANGYSVVNRYLGAATSNKIDVTNYTKIGVKYDYSYEGQADINGFYIFLKEKKLVNNSNWGTGVLHIAHTTNVTDEIKLIDISSYNGSYYIIPWINYSGQVKIKELWLE